MITLFRVWPHMINIEDKFAASHIADTAMVEIAKKYKGEICFESNIKFVDLSETDKNEILSTYSFVQEDKFTFVY
jgi:hypothetical protein